MVLSRDVNTLFMVLKEFSKKKEEKKEKKKGGGKPGSRKTN